MIPTFVNLPVPIINYYFQCKSSIFINDTMFLIFLAFLLSVLHQDSSAIWWLYNELEVKVVGGIWAII